MLTKKSRADQTARPKRSTSSNNNLNDLNTTKEKTTRKVLTKQTKRSNVKLARIGGDSQVKNKKKTTKKVLTKQTTQSNTKAKRVNLDENKDNKN